MDGISRYGCIKQNYRIGNVYSYSKAVLIHIKHTGNTMEQLCKIIGTNGANGTNGQLFIGAIGDSDSGAQ